MFSVRCKGYWLLNSLECSLQRVYEYRLEYDKWLAGQRGLSVPQERSSISSERSSRKVGGRVRVCKLFARLVTKTMFAILALSLLLLATTAPCRAQITATTDNAYVLGTNSVNSSEVRPPAITGQPTVADPAAAGSPQEDETSTDGGWHFALNSYLWFPGVHGTAAGVRGNSLGFSASPGDLLSNSRFGLMGALEVRRNRLVGSLDLLWIRLEDDKALPLPGFVLPPTSANIKATEFLLAPKIGYRVIDEERIKIDALAGFRYWYLGENLKFNPSLLGLNFSGSQDFVDPVLGGRIQVALSPKIVVNILGDVGGWNTGSKLEYQVAGVVGYKIKPKWTLQAGYRYLNVDYHGSRGAVFNATTAGVVVGFTRVFK